ncbi:MarR family transcriptional regulator [Sinomonas albida]|uniref:MarR family winged helix-turn-helix transcriptional regulator n=1 Tax=Sinomonas albida TaxID=369942 RepID=UPI003016D116
MGNSYPQLDLDRQLCFPLYAAARSVSRVYAELLADVGLTYPQYLTMLALWSADGALSVGELGERLRLDSGTLTPLLKRLEAAGYLERRRDPGDERRVLASLTPAGESLQESVSNVPLRLSASLGLAAGDAAALRDLLARLMANLESRGGAGGPAGS